MTTSAAAKDVFVRRESESLKCGERGINIPKGHTTRTNVALPDGPHRVVDWPRDHWPSLRAAAPHAVKRVYRLCGSRACC